VFKKTKIDHPLTAPTKINQSTSMKGEIISKNDIRLDGILNGKINTEKKIIIGIQGAFSGKLKCENLVLEGSIKGEATVSNNTSLHAKSSFNGILSTHKLSVEEGAFFEGDSKTISKNNPTVAIKASAAAKKANSTLSNDNSEQKDPIDTELKGITENTLEEEDNI
jgi:cytoskeletal protein CcmA (bactofilin family)